jgi:membrane protein implicated in regulation of membrane protease activity
MTIIELIASYGAWSWIVAGLVLLALELVVPGGFFLWLGISGLVTGLASLFQPIDWPWQFLMFGLLSLVTIFIWLNYVRKRVETSDRPLLNQRAAQYVGQETLLIEPIRAGSGRVALGDTTWRVAGPDLAEGARVRIVGHDGAVLKVEPA